MSQYTYNINQTVNNRINSADLIEEVVASNISVQILTVTSNDTQFSFNFKIAISPSEETILNQIVTAHEGNEDENPIDLVNLKLQDKSGTPIVGIEKVHSDFDTIATPNYCQDGSILDITANPGHYLTVEAAEAQWTHDLKIENVTEFNLDYFAWYDLGGGNFIQVLATTKNFKSLIDLFVLGNKHSTYPGGENELQTGLTTLHFDYPSALKLYGDPKHKELCKITCRLKTDGEGNPIKPTGTFVNIGFITHSGALA